MYMLKFDTLRSKKIRKLLGDLCNLTPTKIIPLLVGDAAPQMWIF